jgi:hypothetical protein
MVPSMLELIFFYTQQIIYQGYDSHFFVAHCITVQTGFKYSMLTPLYVEAIFAIAGILFWMVQSFFSIARFQF